MDSSGGRKWLFGGLTIALAIAATVPATASGFERMTKQTPVACEGDHPASSFKYGALRAPRTAERSRTAEAGALRRFLRSGELAEGMPQKRWFVLRRIVDGNDRFVEFASGRLHSLATVMFVRRSGGRWRWWNSSEGENCNLRRIAASGWVSAPWDLVRLQLPLDSSATSLTVVMSEGGCNSGGPAGDRASVPQIEYRSEMIVLTGQIVPDHGAHTCPTNPPTSVTVQLDEPIGDRALVDGGAVPANSRLSLEQLTALRAGADSTEVLLFQKSAAEFCRDAREAGGTQPVFGLTNLQFRRFDRRLRKCR